MTVISGCSTRARATISPVHGVRVAGLNTMVLPLTRAGAIFHTGIATEEHISLDAFRIEGEWPGSRTQLIDPTGLGKYQVEMRDLESIQIAWLGTLIGAFLSLPVGLLAARNLFPRAGLVMKPFLAAVRATGAET